MKSTAEQILEAIHGHIVKSGKPLSQWYVGIAADAKTRLFDDHQVPEKNHWWIYREAASDQDARAVEKAFLNAGAQGGPGGGGNDTTFVYAYVITQQTVE